MIDFRYHLVSLISVFIALAVGIALGAGPLKETIGDTLTGQVSQLREEKQAMRVELDAAQVAVAENERYLEEAAGSIVGGALTDRRIGFVLLDEVPDGILSDLEDTFVEAGASVVTRVRVTERWIAEDDQVFRSALAARLVEYLEPPVDLSASVDEILAAALAQSIAGKDPAAPLTLSANAEILGSLLAADDGGLVVGDLPASGAVDAIVVIAGSLDPGSTDETEPPTDEEERAALSALRARAAIALAAQQRSEGAILVIDTYADGDLVSFVRASDDLAERVSTVTRFTAMTGRLSTVLGLGSRIALRVGHYGFDQGADMAAAPRTELPPVDRTPAIVDPGDEQEAGDSDGTETDGTGADGTETDGTQADDEDDDGGPPGGERDGAAGSGGPDGDDDGGTG